MLSNTPRTTVKKASHKAATDPLRLYEIIDESLIGHVAIDDATGPLVIPMLAWRVDDAIYIHGAHNSRLLRQLSTPKPTCVTFTLFDGWVLARSAFHHSAHYRSAVVVGEFTVIEDNREKDRLLTHFIEQIAPGRSQEVRPSNNKELSATRLLRMPLGEASVKMSHGAVNDDESDMSRPVWAGILPYRTVVGPMRGDIQLAQNIQQPNYQSAYAGRWYTDKKE